ncbi:MAG: substrate-binding domain-containing protein [Chloroflexota bacterium]
MEIRLREVRLGADITQGDLAARAGVSRQTVNSIETRRYVPGTDVALRLARVLGCRVEDLFVDDTSTVTVDAGDADAGERVAIGRVGSRVVAHALRGTRLAPDGFVASDGIAGDGDASLFVDERSLERTVLVAGCDPSLPVLAAYVSRKSREHRMVWLHASSEEGLRDLAASAVHVAGTHLPDGGGDSNVSQAKQALSQRGGLIVNYAAWEQGLAVAPGNPKSIREAEDLARVGVRIVNREQGSGARRLLDEMLLAARVPSLKVKGYDVIVPTHMAVARAVAGGAADAGVTLRAAASAFGLGFVPLAEVRFDFVIPAAQLAHPSVQVMLEVLQSRELRADLAALPGYGVSLTGSTIVQLEAA